jgi:hypothetical protein
LTTQRHELISGETLDIVETEENAMTGRYTQSKTNYLKRKPEIEGLHDDAVHKEIMGRRSVHRHHQIINTHRFGDNVAFSPRP